MNVGGRPCGRLRFGRLLWRAFITNKTSVVEIAAGAGHAAIFGLPMKSSPSSPPSTNSFVSKFCDHEPDGSDIDVTIGENLCDRQFAALL